MKIFHATSLSSPELLEKALQEKFSGNHLKLNDKAWLVAGQGTAQDICATLGMPTTPNEVSPFSAVIVGVNGYYGFGGNNIWEWIVSRQAADAQN